MKKLICYILGHDFERRDKWTPSICALIVTKFEQWMDCKRCGHKIYTKFEYDERGIPK